MGDEPGRPPLVVARGGDPASRVRAAVAALGGMERFVKRGETVLVKPNMAWDRTPEQGANTNPEVVAEVVRLCRAAGARRVIVAENPVHDAGRVGRAVGHPARRWRRPGASSVLPGASGFESTTLGGSVLASWDVLSVLFQADRLVNVPVVKHHSLSRLTCGLKNHMGLIGGSAGAAAPGDPPGARGPGGGLPPDADGRGRHARDDAQRADRRPARGRGADRTRWRRAPTPWPATPGPRASSGSTRARSATSSSPRAAASGASRPERERWRRSWRMAEGAAARAGTPRSARPRPPSTCRASSAACTRASSSSSSSRSLALMTDEGIRRFPVRLLLELDPLSALSVLASSWLLPAGLGDRARDRRAHRPLRPRVLRLGLPGRHAAPPGLLDDARAPPRPHHHVNRWRPHFRLKYLLLVALLVAALAGTLSIGLLDPLSLATRSFASALLPALSAVTGAEGQRPRTFAGAWLTGGIFLGLLAANRWIARWWCRALCPLGALLGLGARAAVFRIHVDPDLCNDCHRCVRDCQGADEPFAQHRVAECHVCLNCVSVCPEDAITYRAFAPTAAPNGGVDLPRRQLVGAALAGAALLPLMRASSAEASPEAIRPPGALPEARVSRPLHPVRGLRERLPDLGAPALAHDRRARGALHAGPRRAPRLVRAELHALRPGLPDRRDRAAHAGDEGLDPRRGERDAGQDRHRLLRLGPLPALGDGDAVRRLRGGLPDEPEGHLAGARGRACARTAPSCACRGRASTPTAASAAACARRSARSRPRPRSASRAPASRGTRERFHPRGEPVIPRSSGLPATKDPQSRQPCGFLAPGRRLLGMTRAGSRPRDDTRRCASRFSSSSPPPPSPSAPSPRSRRARGRPHWPGPGTRRTARISSRARTS